MTTVLRAAALVALAVSGFAFLASSAVAQTVTRESGGSIKTELFGGIAVNKGSSLTREWITVHQDALPADIRGTAGVKTSYKPDRVRGEYNYEAEITIETKEPLSAVAVHFLLFDIWGRHVRTLNFTEVADIEGSKVLRGTWRAFSENDVSEYYASIAYVARVRTRGGRVVIAESAPVLTEARKFSAKFSAEDLEPKSERK